MSDVLHGIVITGDGRTVYEPGYVVIENGRIAEVGPGAKKGDTVTEYTQSILAPGIVNLHAHCLTLGPVHATGSKSRTEQQVHDYKQRHLAGATTTCLCVDGLPTWDEYLALNEKHPLKVIKCTTHTPANLRAAELADGEGIRDEHRTCTVDELVTKGAKVIGESGAGGTLGGGMQDNFYIPDAIEKLVGFRIHPLEARAIKEAVLGPKIDPKNLDRAALKKAMEESKIAGKVGEEAVIDAVHKCVLPSMEHAFEGLRETAAAANRLDKPFLVHHAAASMEVCESIANERMIAGHVNHPSFDEEESVESAKRLRNKGVLLEISALDLFTRTRGQEDIKNFLWLVRERLVDFVGTDYAGGNYHPALTGLAGIVARKLVSVPEALALSTGNVARLLPQVTDAGLLEAGRPADVAVLSQTLDAVRAVYINGSKVLG
ncbi:MAG: amidohydrolase family protein [Armatimonadetes bacterium]|nr:amidohydrolase family protein [Armatimonadota bacterium]